MGRGDRAPFKLGMGPSRVDPRAAELAAGRWPEKKCGLAAGKIAASRQPAGKMPQNVQLKVALPRDVNKN